MLTTPNTKNQDTAGFAAIVTDIEKRVTVFSPAMAQQLGELWDEYPALKAHQHALKQTDARASGFNLKYYEQCLSSWWAKHGAAIYPQQNTAPEANGKGIAALQAARADAGQPEPEDIARLAEISERANLNRLCGMPLRNKYPAFRDDLDIEQVREAVFLLMQAERTEDAGEKRALKYQAEKVIYPRQSRDAVRGGFNMILKAGFETAAIEPEKELVAA